MMVDFRRAFKRTPEEKQQDYEFLRKLQQEYINAPKPNLIPDEDGLLVSEPFGAFYGDCCTCKYYLDSNVGFSIGGHCTLKGVMCGYGFTCDKYEVCEVYV